MKSEQWQQIEELYHAALERVPEERAAFLVAACANDADLRREVETLLRHDDEAETFLQDHALAVAADQLDSEELTPTQPLLTGQQLGAYQILAPLGKGGMGEVHLAMDTRLQRKVALKLLPAEFTVNPERVRRFAQEARAASALNHPNILTIYDIGEHEQLHYIVTEFVAGETLRQWMTTAAPQPLAATVAVVAQIAEALAAAHEAGIIHRDIKPENVMVRRDGIVKVLDFGLAKLIGRDEGGGMRDEAETDSELHPSSLIPHPSTLPGIVMGTPRYMSPEQARGEKVDARSDVFSLGVMLYEMLAHRPPFAGATASEVIAALLRDDPPPLTEVAPEAPPELARIVGQALRKNRDERYQAAADLRRDLQQLQEELRETAKHVAAPEISNGASGAAGLKRGLDTAAVAGTPSTEARPPSTTSSAEYVVQKLKRHKLGASWALTLLVIASLSLYLLLPRSSGPSIESLAVLPFANVGAEPNTEYLADGIPESIINSLSQLPQLKVMSRNSVFRYKGRATDAQAAGRELGVQVVLTGRVTQRGESLVINLELVAVRDNRQLWGQQYKRKLADVFAMQEEMAQEISAQLRLKLTSTERQQLAKRPTASLKAFQYYMQGRTYAQRRTREDLLTSLRYCEQAIAEDRKYALAYAGLADAYASLGVRGYLAPAEGRRKAEEFARQALALDENLAEAHAALGGVYIGFSPYNFSLGDRTLRRAIELSPSLAVAHYYLGISLGRQGRLDESLEEDLKARELDPLSSIIARHLASSYYLKRDYGRALEVLRQANELGPAFTAPWEIGIYLQNRLFDETLAELENAKRERQDDPILIYSTGMVYAAQGKRADALQIIKELEGMSGANLSQAHWIAKIYATLNEKELALTWLERGVAAGALGVFAKDDPVWDTIRNDMRFADLLRRMGVPQ